jgi:LmbE family N-acetylglucosaminyl deacetylase
MQDIVTDIIKEQRPCYFISPHLDDAVLSCGELLSVLAGKTEVTVVTVFTAANGKKPTLSARKALGVAGFHSGHQLYAARRQEDLAALKTIKVRAKHLGEVEALWREKKGSGIFAPLASLLPELGHIYPTYRLHIASGKIARADQETIFRIAAKLKRLIPADAVVFAPLGVGSHVDHLVARKAVEQCFLPVYWYDQPYYFRLQGKKRPGTARTVREFRPQHRTKAELAALYKTQFSSLFPNGVMPELREFYRTTG